MPKKEKSAEEIVKEAMRNVDELQSVTQKIQNEENFLNSQEKEQPTLFMMNHNEVPGQKNKTFLSELETHSEKKRLTKAYGIVAIIMSLIAIALVSFMLITFMVLQEKLSGSTETGQFIGNILYSIFVPALGWVGGSICSIVALVFGILGAVKAKKLVVSWIGLVLSVICLIVCFSIYIMTIML